MNAAKALLTGDEGAAIIEYSLIIALISIALVTSMSISMQSVEQGVCSLSNQVAQLLGSPAAC